MLLVFFRFRHLVYTTCTSFFLQPSIELAYTDKILRDEAIWKATNEFFLLTLPRSHPVFFFTRV